MKELFKMSSKCQQKNQQNNPIKKHKKPQSRKKTSRHRTGGQAGPPKKQEILTYEGTGQMKRPLRSFDIGEPDGPFGMCVLSN